MNVDGELLQTYFHYVLRNSITVPGISVAYRNENIFILQLADISKYHLYSLVL